MTAAHVIDAFKARVAGQRRMASNAPTFADLEAHVNERVRAILAAPMSDKAMADLFAGPAELVKGGAK